MAKSCKYNANHKQPENTSGKTKPRRLNKKPRRNKKKRKRQDCWDDEECQ